MTDFKTQSLRIGAQTFFVTYGLPEAFMEFLARRKAPRVAQIYYRASTRLTLCKLRNFASVFREFWIAKNVYLIISTKTIVLVLTLNVSMNKVN